MSHIEDTAFQAGLAHGLRGDYSSSIASFLEAAARFPDVPEVHYELGLAYQRRAEERMPAAMKLREPAPQMGEGTDVVGAVSDIASALVSFAAVSASRALGKTDWIVRYRDDFRRSVTALQKSISLDDGFAGAHFALANSLRYLGQAEAASEAARRAAELSPEDPQIVARAESLESAVDSRPSGPDMSLTWDDVVLPEKTKRELKQMQLLLENPSLSRDLGIEPPTGLLLYGPPGTGKTTIARILASEAKCRFFAASSADINSMWLGESEKQVSRLFAQARANAPAIVFLDEIDALLPTRTGGINQYSDKVVNQFLHEMDGLVRNRRLFVVGATNRRDMLDPALLRGGRLAREIEIPLPDESGRRALFALATRGTKLGDDVNIAALATNTEGFSGANIKALVNEAGLQALIRLSGGGQELSERKLIAEDFRLAFENASKPQETPRNLWPYFGGN